jgi:hypothetical protein
MAGEVLLINPRRRRRRKKARAKARTHRRRRASASVAINRRRPHRRRRINARRRGRRRARINPRIPFLGNVNFNAIGGGFFGYLGTRYAATWALSMLPAQWQADPNTRPMFRIATKAVLGFVALPMLAKTFRLRGVAGPLMVGAGIAILQDIVETWLPNILPLPAGVTSLSDYEERELSDYEVQQLEGDDGGGAYGGGAYGGAGSGAY